ncbi:tyrosine-type recombinase/integrase [Emcibacter nanhaiensis]|uniref:Site-specific integrase n=1 Tax=Emcibacter nanhaiensis TaxID=1505037 RepID=A0A501PHB2_9PROT|nr:site-specific integrase [Emcibacter nanhaiensis]TPD59344.1 site-specific integrase [Emcibacter nanhaiensis]
MKLFHFSLIFDLIRKKCAKSAQKVRKDRGEKMASIRKHGKKWQADIRLKGLRRTKLFKTKMEAQQWAIKQEEFVHPGLHGVNWTFRDAMQRYAKEESVKKRGARWETIRLNKLCRHPIADLTLLDLTPEDFKKWIKDQTDLAPGSILRELQVMSGVLECAINDWNWAVDNPIKRVRKPSKPQPRDRRISDAEIASILKILEFENEGPAKSLRQEIAVAFLLAIETAMRQGELWGLEWERVDLQKQYLRLPMTKNGFRRDVPLSKRAVELFGYLGPRKSGKVFSVKQKSAGTIFRRSVKLAEIENLTFHDTRHEAISRLARKLDVLDLARMVGHRDPRSLMIYYNASASEIAGRLG